MTLVLFFFVQLTLLVISIRMFYKKRKLFTNRFSMIMSITFSSVWSLQLSLLLFMISLKNTPTLWGIVVLLGASIGTIFGSMSKFHSLIAGFSHGVIGAMMGASLAAVILDPSICSLPINYATTVEQNLLVISTFGLCISVTTFGVMFYSLKV
ncbi:hypothetical protein [Bacillus alkalisoli]|uniref:hypothetical protein n=1 Tax=Bacillus alkalisoli TaxID=2011008 RepID=UPI000C239ED8|nr:hypothetical protein [Bacillus alkalisoli]